MVFEIDNDEVILYEGSASYSDANNQSKEVDFTLTSKKMVFVEEKGFLKKTKTVFDIVNLDEIKVYNGEVQCKQKSNVLQIQTINKNFSLSFYGVIEAKKIEIKIIDAVTGTTLSKRGSNKVKSALDLVDDTLGLDTRGVAKGLIENGITGTLLHGIKKKNK